MKTFINSVLFLFIIFVFTACDNRESSKQASSFWDKGIGERSNVADINQTEYGCDGGVVVNGYTLPPCVDKKLNDSTMLGIDSNNNGVRDDVERWIIIRYKDHHKIATEIGFQVGRAFQFMLENPDKPQEARKLINGAQNCNAYFILYAKDYGEPKVIDHSITSEGRLFLRVQLNTNKRTRAFLNYDQSLSGEVYVLPKIDQFRSFCAFDIKELLGE